MQLEDSLLNEIISGRYDLARAAADFAAQTQRSERMNDLNRQLARALKNRQWDAAATALDTIASLLPAQDRLAFAADTRLQILLGQKKYDQAYQFADSLGDSAPYNDFAWTILTQRDVEQRNVLLALKFAQTATRATGGTNAAVLDTLARAQFMCGRTNEAIRTQQQAIRCKKPGDPTDYEKTLSSYQQGQLPEAGE